MRMNLLKTVKTEEGYLSLAEESTSYKVDRRLAYDNPRRIYDLACQLDCDMLADEEAYCLCLDTRLKPIGLFLVGKGGNDGCPLPRRELFQKALLLGAVKIVLWHNHPSGDPTPSSLDIYETRKVKEAGEIVAVELLDHIVVARGCYRSLKEEGCI